MSQELGSLTPQISTFLSIKQPSFCQLYPCYLPMLYTHGLVPRSGVEIILFTEDNRWNAKKEKNSWKTKWLQKQQIETCKIPHACPTFICLEHPITLQVCTSVSVGN